MQDPVEEIKSKLDITEVVATYVPLKQSGRNLKAPCPFHNEKTASFMVSPDKRIYHCFGCGEGGDIFSFVMKMEGLDFRGALEMLARKAGVELAAVRGDREGAKVKDRLFAAHELAIKYYQASLIKNTKALDYVTKKRRLGKQAIGDFGIGYAPESWEGLSKFLMKKGFTAEELKKAGLVGQRPGRSTVYDMFRGRVMLSICDATGRPIGFTGRVLGEDVPKYLNTPQTVLYDKGRAIYGLHLAKEAIRTQDSVVLVEGNMDVVASHQAGIKQVVAVSGTALSMDQLKALSRLTKNISLCFDEDSAGLKATERAIELAQQLGLVLKVVVTVGAKDPDELIQRDPDLWRGAIADAKYVVDYMFDRAAAQYDLKTSLGKRGYADFLSPILKRLADPVELNHYVKLLAEKTGTSEEAVEKRVASTDLSARDIVAGPAKQVIEPRRAMVQVVPHAKSGKHMLEETVLSINLVYPEVRMSLDDLKPSDFSEERREVFDALQSDRKGKRDSELTKGLHEEMDYAKILTLRGEEEYSTLAPADRSFEAFQLVRRLQTASNNKTKEEISHQLREAEKTGDTQLVRSLLSQYQALMLEE